MKLVFATNNKHKIEEIQEVLEGKFELVSLSDIGCYDDIPESFETLEENARAKAEYVFNNYGYNCFADDTGLEIEALNWRPGVYSARYAGDEKNPEANIKKALIELSGIENRKARFRTVICLIIDGETISFEGVVNGDILKQKQGTSGFGYDPVFRPDNFNMSFAEMPLDEKNKISHRGNAVRKLVEYLNDNYMQ